jgi:hypothetical protein
VERRGIDRSATIIIDFSSLPVLAGLVRRNRRREQLRCAANCARADVIDGVNSR